MTGNVQKMFRVHIRILSSYLILNTTLIYRDKNRDTGPVKCEYNCTKLIGKD